MIPNPPAGTPIRGALVYRNISSQAGLAAVSNRVTR